MFEAGIEATAWACTSTLCLRICVVLKHPTYLIYMYVFCDKTSVASGCLLYSCYVITSRLFSHSSVVFILCIVCSCSCGQYCRVNYNVLTQCINFVCITESDSLCSVACVQCQVWMYYHVRQRWCSVLLTAFPSVLWCCWLGLLACKTRPTNIVLVETLSLLYSILCHSFPHVQCSCK